jgi:hypothetical protein
MIFKFSEVVTTEAEFRGVIGHPSDSVLESSRNPDALMNP